MTRGEALGVVASRLRPEIAAMFTTGHISRGAYGAGDRDANFYMIGSMGLLASVGLGVALCRPERRLVVVDGDGSALMSLGTLAQIGEAGPRNLVHVVVDNEAYVSTGGQRTISGDVDLAEVARAAGYRVVLRADDAETLGRALDEALTAPGPAFVAVKALTPDREAGPRVVIEPPELRDRFRRALSGAAP